MTPMEKMQLEYRRNPHRFHTCTRFDSFFQNNERSSTKKSFKQTVANESMIKEKSGSRRNQSNLRTDIRSSERHKSCAPAFEPNSFLSSAKREKSPKKHQRQKSTERKVQSINRILANQTQQSGPSIYRELSSAHKKQTALTSFVQNDSIRHVSNKYDSKKPSTANC